MRKSAGDKKEKLTKEQRKAELRRKIDMDPDFIYSPAHNNSLKEFLRRRGEVNNSAIARVLQITEDEVESSYQSALTKIRESLELEDELGLSDEQVKLREERSDRLIKLLKRDK